MLLMSRIFTETRIQGLMWNIALDGGGNPKLPGTDSCNGPGCRPLVTINTDGSFELNQECTSCDFFICPIFNIHYSWISKVYAMAQASKAVIPKDIGGPFGQRIGVNVGGSLSWALRVSAFMTGRVSSSDWDRFSIVVLNCK